MPTLVAVQIVIAMMLLSTAAAASPSTQGVTPSHRTMVAMLPATTTIANLTLQTTAAPGQICAMNTSTCTSGNSQTRVQLTAQAAQPTTAWPAVQIAFVIETTAYDGVYDPKDAITIEKQTGAGFDACGLQAGGGPLCEESNGVPFFEDHVSSITSVIQAANPHSKVSYAMVDYASSCDVWDDYCDQTSYHVDNAQFLDGVSFGNSVSSEFRGGVLSGGYVLHDEDLADNFLHSPSIMALYGVIAGSGLDWSNNTHHVIVWMGSTAPRDPSYVQDYCVSGSGMLIDVWGYCSSPSCEPAHQFPGFLSSPNCEGWIHSQDGDPSHSIAALAHNAPNCVNSVGGVCTIDAIDLWDTPTDPFSQGWPTENVGYTNEKMGPGTPGVLKNSERILYAGCDIAAATGGTWSGPSFFTCPNGQAGSLAYVPHGSITNPNTQNPTLLNAFRQIGFGPIENTLVAVGTSSPMFTYIPPTNFVVASNPDFAVACTTPTGYFVGCSATPKVTHYLGTAVFGWNWSENRTQNRMYYGDAWRVSFNVINTGAPYGNVPVISCVTKTCLSDGSRSIAGQYSWAHYQLPNATTIVTTSFPLALVIVSLTGIPPAAIVPPAVPAIPPAVPILVPTTVNNPVAIGLPIVTPIGSFSLQAMAAGLLMAGITRVMMKNKPIAMQMAMKAGPASSKFDAAQRHGPDTGHFE